MSTTEITELRDFKDSEIESEYVHRFGEPADVNPSDFSYSELCDELKDRGEWPGHEMPEGFEEILDFVAEAARLSPHAKRAYDLLRHQWPEVNPLHSRQSMISGRMAELA